jgi:hypothetical protein
MDARTFFEEHQGVRRIVLAICVIWCSVTISTGLWVMLDRALTVPDATFMTAVIALMQVPVAFYFYHRGKK